MLSSNIYKVLYFITHRLYTIFFLIYQYLIYVNFWIKTILYEVLSTREKAKYIQNHLYAFVKKPKHLTVIIGEEMNIQEVAKLIIWCIRTQISFISFYDHKDILKKHTEELQYEVSQRKGKSDHVIWYKDDKSTYKNGFVGNKIHVKFINQEDGRKSVVKLVKNLALQDFETIDIDKINVLLSKQYQFPDPDMGLICGDEFILLNYPPWQLRLTEFFKLNNIKGITLPLFLNLLGRFSKCEQRLGT